MLGQNQHNKSWQYSIPCIIRDIRNTVTALMHSNIAFITEYYLVVVINIRIQAYRTRLILNIKHCDTDQALLSLKQKITESVIQCYEIIEPHQFFHPQLAFRCHQDR